jgi:hypothetical protein
MLFLNSPDKIILAENAFLNLHEKKNYPDR